MAPLGLYIHVPFCRQKCDWCAFASQEGSDLSRTWLDKILDQIQAPPVPGARWKTVYWGGGTPSLLTPDQLDRLMVAVAPRLDENAELTLEVNPESFTRDHLDVWKSRGGTRLSVGVQTFQEDILVRHGRPTRARHLGELRSLLRDWPGSLSLDLIAGLEGQTSQGQHEDLVEALDWDPDHISFYLLGVEPGTPLFLRVQAGTASLPPEEEAVSWWLDGRDHLAEAGLPPYEVSNFAKPGAESVHNQGYWALDPWWGLGPSAASFLPRSGGGFEYRTETEDLGEWLEGRPAIVEVPSELDLVKDRLLAGIRRARGVSVHPWVELLPRTIEKWQGRALVNDQRLFLSQEAFLVMDAFLRDAFGELDGRPVFR